MMTQHKNVKIIKGETQNYKLFKEILLKKYYTVSHDSISLKSAKFRGIPRNSTEFRQSWEENK
jgi:hypothetical protein